MAVKIKNEPEIRYLYDMKEVLYDKKWLKKAKIFAAYYMYRGLKKKKGLRYDITVIPARFLGREPIKTKGHYHKGNFPELYIVLSGKAIFLVQRGRGKEIKDIYAVLAKKSESVIIPRGYGHVTINPSKKTLKVANWVLSKGRSDYVPFEKMQGAGYYFTKTGWLKNKNYEKVPPLRFEKPLSLIPNLSCLK